MLFSASWCKPCKILKEWCKEIPEIEIIDVEENEDLVQKYQIISVPTLIITENGDVVKSKSGNFINREEFHKFIDYGSNEN